MCVVPFRGATRPGGSVRDPNDAGAGHANGPAPAPGRRDTGGWPRRWGCVRGWAAQFANPKGVPMSVLDDIVAGVREDLERRRSATSEADLRAHLLKVPPALDPM